MAVRTHSSCLTPHRSTLASILSVAVLAGLFVGSAAAEDWKPAEAPIMTRWAKEVSPENVLPEYPRPQLVREKWQNLNGLWDYAIIPTSGGNLKPQGQILVPFAIESALSGVGKPVSEKEQLYYRRTFTIPSDWKNQNVILHFGAVDWRTTVTVNGKEVGKHEGGYDPFSFDITKALKSDGEQTLEVLVWDPTDKGPQPRGKQLSNPHGIWYTPVTGIWQTVWLEPVAKTHIESIQFDPGQDWRKEVQATVKATGDATVRITVTKATSQENPKAHSSSKTESQVFTGKAGETFTIKPGYTQFWTPEEPWLIHCDVELLDGDKPVDSAKSYFALRKIEIAKDQQGINRIFLNDKAVFHYGLLDQGWWPDGLYTAPTDEALLFDILKTKELGFNMARKHVKVEPARWYNYCDKYGLLVWQDMPSGDKYIKPDQDDYERTPEAERIYREEWTAIVNATRFFPSIVVWVPFNEGWGQFKTNEILAYTKDLDPTRLVDGPSGWTDRGEGDMHDMHKYPGPGMFPVESNRASVLGEFGGLGLPIEGHLWKQQRNWGYRTYETREELLKNYLNLVRQLPPLIDKGLAGAIYTQTTDVEIEVNGMMTYDREIIKFPVDRLAKAHQQLYAPPAREMTVVPTSEKEPQTWQYTTSEPQAGWQTGTDASGWKEGPGGFGTEGTPGTIIGTTWNTFDIWIRGKVSIPSSLQNPAIRIHHDEDAQVYLNGKLVLEVKDYTTDYVTIPIDGPLPEGEVTLAVHCSEIRGGQYIDVGIVDRVPLSETATQKQPRTGTNGQKQKPGNAKQKPGNAKQKPGNAKQKKAAGN